MLGRTEVEARIADAVAQAKTLHRRAAAENSSSGQFRRSGGPDASQQGNSAGGHPTREQGVRAGRGLQSALAPRNRIIELQREQVCVLPKAATRVGRCRIRRSAFRVVDFAEESVTESPPRLEFMMRNQKDQPG
jgi:hypothetical protein